MSQLIKEEQTLGPRFCYFLKMGFPSPGNKFLNCASHKSLRDTFGVGKEVLQRRIIRL